MADRYTEVHKSEGFLKTEFDDIKKGDVFKLFEPDGRLVTDDAGCSVFLAGQDAKDGVISVYERYKPGEYESYANDGGTPPKPETF